MSKAACLIRAQVAEITLLRQRIVFLEREAMLLQKAAEPLRAELIALRVDHADLQRRYGLIMLRTLA